MVCLEDNNAAPENSTQSIDDRTALKNLQEGERASTPVSIVMADYVTATPEGSSGMTLSLTGIKLHSPSAIMGTPLDPSSRFEYPFPSPQPEYEPHHPVLHTSRSPHPSNFLTAGSSSSRQRQSHVHPKHDVREVPIPPGLDKRVNIELRFPHPMEGVDVLRQAHSSIKRRTGVDSVSRNGKKYPRPQPSTLQDPL